MIPQFEESGWLPPGVFPATLDEIETRFGLLSEIRKAQMESVQWLLELALQAGISRVVLNGSFVTDIMDPNDVDCVLLPGVGYPVDTQAADAIEEGLPFLDIHVVNEPVFEALVNQFFATDRSGRSKGVVEVIRWK